MAPDTLTIVGVALEIGAIAVASWYLKRHWKVINDEAFAAAAERAGPPKDERRKERRKG